MLDICNCGRVSFGSGRRVDQQYRLKMATASLLKGEVLHVDYEVLDKNSPQKLVAGSL